MKFIIMILTKIFPHVFEEEMIPQISVLLVCGYYGYPTYDENFVKKCKAQWRFL